MESSFVEFDYISDDDSCVIIVEGLPPFGTRSKSSQSTLDKNIENKDNNEIPTESVEAANDKQHEKTFVEEVEEVAQSSLLEGSFVLSTMGSVMSTESRILDACSSTHSSLLNNPRPSQSVPDFQNDNTEPMIGNTSNWSQMIQDIIESGIYIDSDSKDSAAIQTSQYSTITDDSTTQQHPELLETESSSDKIILSGVEDDSSASTSSWLIRDGIPLAPSTAVQTTLPTLHTSQFLIVHQDTAVQTDPIEEILPPPPSQPLPSPTATAEPIDEPDENLPLKISFMDFQVGDIALFLPVNEKRDIWMAFHAYQPHRYLAQESLNLFLSKGKKEATAPRTRILGKIFYLETQIASETNNPYQLPIGTLFHTCFVEPISVLSQYQRMQQHQK